MRGVICAFLVLAFISGCDKNDQSGDIFELQGRWNLVSVYNTSTGATILPKPGNTHYYTINVDGTFMRTLVADSISSDLVGTFTFSDKNNLYGNEDGSIKKFVELTYGSPEADFFNCGAIEGNKQLLILTEDDVLQNTLDGACDGPEYSYKKLD